MAIDVREIHSLTEFKRDTNRFLKRLRASGSPLVLTGLLAGVASTGYDDDLGA